MKKFTTVLCALAIALSVNAAPLQAQAVTIERYNYFISGGSSITYYLHSSDAEDLHFEFEFPLAAGAHQLEFGKTYTLADMNATDCGWSEYDAEDNLIFHTFTAATFQIRKGEGYDIHIAATATDDLGSEYTFAYDEDPLVVTGEEVDVNISRPLSGYEYNGEEGSWLVRAQDNSFNVQLQYYSTDSDSPAGTFGAADFDLSNTYIGIQTEELDEWDEPVRKDVYAKDAQITVTKNDDRIDVTGYILGEDGVRYNIILFYALPKADSQENFDAGNLQVDDWAFEVFGEVQVFASTEDDKSISLDLYGDQEAGIPGTYEIDGRSGGSISVDGEQYEIYSGSVTITFADGEYSVSGTVLCWNNVEYTLNLSEPEVVVTQKEFASENMVIDIYTGQEKYYEVSGLDETGNYLLLTVNSAVVAGDFTTAVDSAYTYAEIDGNTYSLVSANIHVTYAGGKAAVTGTLNLLNTNNKYDAVELTLNLNAGPYVPSERNVTIGQIYHTNVDYDKIGYALRSEDEQQIFEFVIEVPLWDQDIVFDSTYTQASMFANGSIGENKTEREYIMYRTVSFKKTAVSEDRIKIEVTILDTRGNTWNLIYEGEDMELEGMFVELGQANPISHADGGIEYEMVDKDNTLSCHLVLPGADEDAVVDSLYTSEDGGIDLDLSYLSIQKKEYKIAYAEIRKEVSGDEVWVSANVTDERGYIYMLRYYDDGFVLSGDTIQVKVNAELEATYWEDYSEWILRAEADSVSVKFSVISSNPELQTGEYDVDAVVAWSSDIEFLTGMDDEGLPVYSMVGIHSVERFAISGEEGNYVLEAVITGEDGNVYVITAGGGTEAIETVNMNTGAKAVKRIVNGQLLIEKNGVLYNVQGAVVK